MYFIAENGFLEGGGEGRKKWEKERTRKDWVWIGKDGTERSSGIKRIWETVIVIVNTWGKPAAHSVYEKQPKMCNNTWLSI